MAMDDLLDRLNVALERVTDLQGKAAAKHNLSEFNRLVGKAEGIGLAISYLREAPLHECVPEGFVLVSTTYDPPLSGASGVDK
jgi:hypothetical protein